MNKLKKPNVKKKGTGEKRGSDQTLQKRLISQVTRLFLMLVITLIVVSGAFMYFSNIRSEERRVGKECG